MGTGFGAAENFFDKWVGNTKAMARSHRLRRLGKEEF
jgi:hypothetical protein